MVPDLADTIVAIGTAAGGAARAMIRISGSDAVAIISRSFRARDNSVLTIRTPQVVSGELSLGEGLPALPCDLFLWPGESSYTRQPSAELHTLGSPPLLELAVANLCRQGARLAEPGEFTLRAFLAGRLDLTQAEAVLGVIDATNTTSLQTALGQLAGGLSKPLGELREQLLQLLAHLEAGLDFVDEDIEFISKAEIAQQLTAAQLQIATTLEQLKSRAQPQTLPKVVLAGQPNAGKSSLFNALLERFPTNAERRKALVSDIAGTTRDYLSATIELNGIVSELIDTAGIDARETDGIAGEAQTMAASQLRQANCTVWCVDISSPQFAQEIAELPADEDGLLVITKADLSDAGSFVVPATAIRCSSRTGEGLELLAAAIATTIGRDEAGTVVASTAARCLDSLARAQESVQSALNLVNAGGGDELIAIEIRTTLEELGRVVGAVYTDDILDRIFSAFCIGK
jgi:tRNA modification GTPase